MPNANKNEIKRVEITIGNILRWGVLISAAIMIAGLLLFILKGGLGYPKGYYAKSFHQIWEGLIQLKPYSVMMLGIFALILTPVLRVVVSIYSFYKEKDFTYVYITTFVLLILIFSFLLGIIFHL
ncbi:DUF1634 domain-containing protein [Fructilactobacillus sanfranciscensis]|uniref:DUF1634 domain-containing protein n=1 Tax=Fructilactobacillus sanfranciscensis TaxID=1625 RepID=UPI000CD45446|nr:DUF1634 domain-containing protein [Fructilactobacillus sanfranciscensis]POH17708.1 hypothetical protein BGL45_02985 [Fructilactobacillus sanfranciscensis]